MRLIFLMTMAAAFNDQQAFIAREVMRELKPPDWSVIIDAVQIGTYAFTEQSSHRTYIDGRRFANAPRTFVNTCIHEVSHLKGGQHNDGSVGMQYVMTTKPDGTVIEDSSLIVPIPGLHL